MANTPKKKPEPLNRKSNKAGHAKWLKKFRAKNNPRLAAQEASGGKNKKKVAA